MKLTQIHKLYISNFLTGLVFWYGIEKLFMTDIGIGAVGVAVATAVYLAFNLIFDIPSGLLADRWSRKGVLMVSAAALAISSVLFGGSNGLGLYVLGELFYGAYMVAASGTYAALTYDILHEEGRADQYSKVSGRAYAIFLASAGLGDILGGFLASRFDYRFTFFITVVSCVLNFLLIASIREPKFHKNEQKERAFRQLKDVTMAVVRIALVRSLAIVMSAFAILELFKAEFGQLYLLRYVSEAQVMGLLWAAYAFAWALGSLIAHKLRARLNLLVVLSVVPFVTMAFVDSWVSIGLFMVQVVASAALTNQIETRVQENTPSALRASILSVLSSVGRAISIPASLVLGWIIHHYNAFWALRFVACVAVGTLFYWVWSGWRLERRAKRADVDVPTVIAPSKP